MAWTLDPPTRSARALRSLVAFAAACGLGLFLSQLSGPLNSWAYAKAGVRGMVLSDILLYSVVATACGVTAGFIGFLGSRAPMFALGILFLCLAGYSLAWAVVENRSPLDIPRAVVSGLSGLLLAPLSYVAVQAIRRRRERSVA